MATERQHSYPWRGHIDRAEYRRWLLLIIPVELSLLVALALYGERGMIRLDFSSLTELAFGLFCIATQLLVLILTARRFRSADLSGGWLVMTLFIVNIPVGAYYWNVSVTIMLIAITLGALAPDAPKGEAVS